MKSEGQWVTDTNIALLVDLYELTMVRAYWEEGMQEDAVFSLFVRRLPPERNYLVACGLADVLRYLEQLRFPDDALAYLAQRDEFTDAFLSWLADFRFTGTVHAVPEGTPLFAGEPILEVIAPLPQAQLVETVIMNQIHLQTTLASKAARVARAAGDRTVVDFGLRRMHGVDAGLKAARAFYIAGIDATSNVLAGAVYGIPVAGTMAHSYVQAHEREADAFRAFVGIYPETILLVDTYDTLDGVRRVIELRDELGDAFAVKGVRLDSGDLSALARDARQLLDDAGLTGVEIFASGGLDEDVIARMVADDVPIGGFGVGTGMGVAADAPALDIAYKLTEYAGRGRLKLSTGKQTLPGRKQIYRVERSGRAEYDVLTRYDDRVDGKPLLTPVMHDGQPVGAAPTLADIRSYADRALSALPERLMHPAAPEVGFAVRISDRLDADRRRVAEAVRRSATLSASPD